VTEGSRPPVIGISSYAESASWGVWHRAATLLPRTYVDAVAAAGGAPVLLPPVPESMSTMLAAMDGIVLSGGPDIDPARYGANPHDQTTTPQHTRDEAEFQLVAAALAADVPVLAICRGMQLLNVARGGRLHQHVPDVVGTNNHRIATATYARAEVGIRPGSRLADVLGERALISCYHHQAIESLGDGVEPVAWAADGTIEAVELPSRRFALGVQWHPEEDLEDLRLFTALMRAAADRHPAGV
jgi:gamma-glutamyl-gamma-aminobutyrate hydrolase PuuD